MRPSLDTERRVLLARWGVFAIVLVAAIVAFFILAPEIAPLARRGAP